VTLPTCGGSGAGGDVAAVDPPPVARNRTARPHGPSAARARPDREGCEIRTGTVYRVRGPASTVLAGN
jgi:hypothetical protein